MVDVLSSMISRVVKEGELKTIRMKRSYPWLSHLTDDSIFLIEEKEENARTSKEILEIYGVVSRQEVNFSKSSLSFSSNTKQETKEKIGEVLGINVASRPSKYLIVPTE